MRRFAIAMLFTLLPVIGTAQDNQVAATADYGWRDVLLVSAGVIAGAIVVDLWLGGMLTVPSPVGITPAMQEAGAAGAVFGDQIAAATLAKDIKARADVIYVLVVGGAAILGGWAANSIGTWLSTTSMPVVPHNLSTQGIGTAIADETTGKHGV